MPRKKRVWYPGATYHVMSRGNRRAAIFRDKSDYLEFLECTVAVKKAFDLKIHSLCLMTNHFHMAVETKETELWKAMHKLLLTYAANYNIKYKLTGHLFENRYTAQLIENERYFLEVSRYIHLNPVKAQMVREPASYEYSSYPLRGSTYVRSGRRRMLFAAGLFTILVKVIKYKQEEEAVSVE